jgi:hypothetical protein
LPRKNNGVDWLVKLVWFADHVPFSPGEQDRKSLNTPAILSLSLGVQDEIEPEALSRAFKAWRENQGFFVGQNDWN